MLMEYIKNSLSNTLYWCRNMLSNNSNSNSNSTISNIRDTMRSNDMYGCIKCSGFSPVTRLCHYCKDLCSQIECINNVYYDGKCIEHTKKCICGEPINVSGIKCFKCSLNDCLICGSSTETKTQLGNYCKKCAETATFSCKKCMDEVKLHNYSLYRPYCSYMCSMKCCRKGCEENRMFSSLLCSECFTNCVFCGKELIGPCNDCYDACECRKDYYNGDFSELCDSCVCKVKERKDTQSKKKNTIKKLKNKNIEQVSD